MTGRRGLLISLALLVVGAIALWLASNRVWASATVTSITGAKTHVEVRGHDVAPAMAALGLAALALVAAVLATRRWARRIVGVVAVIVGGAVIAVGVAAAQDTSRKLSAMAFGVERVPDPGLSAWAVVTVLAGVAITFAGAATVVVGARWASLSARYDAPAGARDDPATTWDALDRGEDPTA
jgi:uncharacterized membrane protein (TIGR02234 family)